MANVTKLILIASQYVDIAWALVQMIIGNTGLTWLSIRAVFEAASNGDRMCRKDKYEYNEKELDHLFKGLLL